MTARGSLQLQTTAATAPPAKAVVDSGAPSRSSAKRLTVEGAIQVLIMLAIGAAAAAASFTHVHDVAAAHGQTGWLAWADAVVLELMSVASGLEMRRRKRIHSSVKSPAVVLVIAVSLSLSAQVVEAEPSAIGWIAAAIPALGFLVMVKVALAQTAVPPADASSALPGIALQDQPVSGVPEVNTYAADHAALTSVLDARAAAQAPEAGSTAPTGLAKQSSNGVMPTGAGASLPDPVVAALVPIARSAAAELDEQGRRLSRHALADALRQEGYGISNARASALLNTLKSERYVSPLSPARGRTLPLVRP